MPCVDNKDLIYNIKELPETFSIAELVICWLSKLMMEQTLWTLTTLLLVLIILRLVQQLLNTQLILILFTSEIDSLSATVEDKVAKCCWCYNKGSFDRYCFLLLPLSGPINCYLTPTLLQSSGKTTKQYYVLTLKKTSLMLLIWCFHLHLLLTLIMS